MKTLIVYYSLTGRTKEVAEQVAAKLGAEVERIKDVRPRSGFISYLKSGYEALKKRVVDIQPTQFDPANFDLVVIGTPVWAGNISSPVRTYIEMHSGQFKRVAFFCTQGGSGGEKVLAQMASVCGKTPIRTEIFYDKRIDKGEFGDSVVDFTRELEVLSV